MIAQAVKEAGWQGHGDDLLICCWAAAAVGDYSSAFWGKRYAARSSGCVLSTELEVSHKVKSIYEVLNSIQFIVLCQILRSQWRCDQDTQIHALPTLLEEGGGGGYLFTQPDS